jgi:polyisoprenoid-binding protein YceI
MRLFRMNTLMTLLFISLTACSLGSGLPQPPSPAPTRAESSPPPTPTAPVAATQQPEADGTQTSPAWVCRGGQLPPSAESAQVEMGPGAGIPASPAQGERLSISAVVYTNDCQPLSGVTINLWQTDPQGVYGPGHGSSEMQCCYYLGSVTPDENGRFDLLTVKPGAYQGEASPPPAHIHVEIVHPDLQGWQTEIVFTGDPHLPTTVPQGMIAIPLEEKSQPDGMLLFGEAEIITPLAGQKPAGQAAQVAAPTRYTLRPGASQASYQIREKFADIASMVSATGITTLVEGELLLDENLRPVPHGVRITVDLRGLKTDDPQRDEKLADRWLVTDDHPFATFTSTRVEPLPAEIVDGGMVAFTLYGDLTIRGITRPVSFTVSASWQDAVVTGDAQTTIRMSDFGIDPPNLLGFVKVEDEVLVHLEAAAGEG